MDYHYLKVTFQYKKRKFTNLGFVVLLCMWLGDYIFNYFAVHLLCITVKLMFKKFFFLRLLFLLA